MEGFQAWARMHKAAEDRTVWPIGILDSYPGLHADLPGRLELFPVRSTSAAARGSPPCRHKRSKPLQLEPAQFVSIGIAPNEPMSALGRKRTLLYWSAPGRSPRPHACDVGAKPFDRAGWVFQLKYDGFRVLAMRSGTGIRTPVTAGDRKNQMGVASKVGTSPVSATTVTDLRRAAPSFTTASTR